MASQLATITVGGDLMLGLFSVSIAASFFVTISYRIRLASIEVTCEHTRR